MFLHSFCAASELSNLSIGGGGTQDLIRMNDPKGKECKHVSTHTHTHLVEPIRRHHVADIWYTMDATLQQQNTFTHTALKWRTRYILVPSKDGRPNPFASSSCRSLGRERERQRDTAKDLSNWQLLSSVCKTRYNLYDRVLHSTKHHSANDRTSQSDTQGFVIASSRQHTHTHTGDTITSPDRLWAF